MKRSDMLFRLAKFAEDLPEVEGISEREIEDLLGLFERAANLLSTCGDIQDLKRRLN